MFSTRDSHRFCRQLPKKLHSFVAYDLNLTFWPQYRPVVFETTTYTRFNQIKNGTWSVWYLGTGENGNSRCVFVIRETLHCFACEIESMTIAAIEFS